MKINRVLNNNSVVVKEGDTEKIVMGSGIAFRKGRNDLIDQKRIEKVFILKEESEKFKELLQTLPEEHILLGEEIISYAEEKLGVELNNHIHISLTDHLSFAIERTEKGIRIKNKLINEIRLLYHDEFQIGLWAVDHVKKRIGQDLPIDEAAYIAIHIHTAKMNDINVEKSIQKAVIVQDMVDMISSELNIEIERGSMSYQRLITHLEFAINRHDSEQAFQRLDEDMLTMIKEKYKKSFTCAKNVSSFVRAEYNIKFPDSELAYIALHIQRLIHEKN